MGLRFHFEISDSIEFSGAGITSHLYFNCEKGARQGENLSSLHFSLYLNDLETFLLSENCKSVEVAINDDHIELFIKLFAILYADDTILMGDDERHFQDLLNYFADYCRQWHLKINTSKTKIMIFGGNTRSTLDDSVVEIVKAFKYLCVLFTQNGRFVQKTKKLSDLACKAMYLLRRRIVNLNLPIDCQLKLFDKLSCLFYYTVVKFMDSKIFIRQKKSFRFLKKYTQTEKEHAKYYGQWRIRKILA